MKNKILIIISLTIIIFVSIIANIYILSQEKNSENTDNKNVITGKNNKILEDSIVNDLNITDVAIITKNDISTYNAKISNNTKNTISVNRFYIIFYQNNVKKKILGLTNFKLKPNESKNINIVSEIDLTNITKIEYVTE